MKRILFLIAAVLLVAAASAKGGDKTAPSIEFSAMSHDFGTIAEDGGPVKCEFTFTNTGDAPLVIVSATASCGCTKPKFSKEPIKPGKTGKISVTYYPKGHPGEISKMVKVRTNVPGKKRITLRLEGFVTPQK